MSRVYLAVFVTAVLGYSNIALASSKPEISGFARAIVGVADHDDVDAIDYDKTPSLKPHSLIGVQADWQITQHWSATAQMLGRADRDLKSGIEWLYAQYAADHGVNYKVGRLRSPFFMYSNVLNVGYSYHWIQAPSEVYSPVLFDHFDGGEASYTYFGEDFSATVSGFLGQFDGDVEYLGEQYTTDVNTFSGLVFEVSFDKLKLQSSINRGNIFVKNPMLSQLSDVAEQAGLSEVAQALSIDGEVTYFQVGFSYETFDYFIKGEWVDFHHDFSLLAETRANYISVGYQLDNLLFHLTAAKRDDALKPMNDFIPPIDALSPLAGLYHQLSNVRAHSDQDSYIFGVRWDVGDNIALKAEVNHTIFDQDDLDPALSTQPEDTTLVLLGAEWVF
ncbi:hypothetical protein [Psychrobium sp. 1_MG-2023]|uniref:hypothetical protein n=1 Tax=Psychrobium sp. 1_MG-2023 TaxID=3062624 RepID=UPI000C342025|nr:hypothetical protein [Psychrobium sp. 1_MG-2023]MDP2562826.1 hypothetical protein [Psychrobium sp. 1_MG-2023]PKF57954.1 hypothetical protein CW748_05390 [Alteromonadales bacterium alter-6D02]